MSGCTCEPTTYDDGSASHETDCAAYPWCPHEVGAYSCLLPCGCPCAPCVALNHPTPALPARATQHSEETTK